MAHADAQTGLQPSLLDRLSDPESGGIGGQGGYSISQMIDSVRSDLEDLLNSHRTVGVLPAEYEQVRNSIVTYGLPDLVSYQSTAPEVAKKVAVHLEEVIARFEPRLKNVRVRVLQMGDSAQLKLEFQVHATLRVDPAPEVAFLTVLKLTTGEASIRQVEE
jgi:type VI secretion system protein ImpF